MNAHVFYDASGDVLPRKASVKASRGYGRAYSGASLTDPDLSSWSNSNPSPHAALNGDRNVLAARIHDLARNDGWASGGVSRMVDAIIGANWRLSSRPNGRALGLDPDQVHDVASEIEAKWKLWADDIDCRCDAGRRLNWGGLLALGFRHRIWDGEAVAIIHWIKRAGYCTAVEVMHPDRLSNPNDMPDTNYLRSGIELGSYSEPLAYNFRGAHPGDAYIAANQMWNWKRIPAETAWGRRQVVHAFEPGAAGIYRGVSPLAPILKKIRMLGRYDEVEMQAAMLNAVMAAFVTSPYDEDQVAKSMSDDDGLSAYQEHRLDWHENQKINLGGAKVNFLAAGEKVELTNPNHPNSVYEAFQRTVLRNIATAIGVSYEQLSMDWSQVNYSSARAALIEIWRGFTARKDFFAAQFAQPIFAAWLEEAIDKGDIKLPKGCPDFYQAKSAWCQAKWIGPGRGWVDPQKEANAAGIRLDNQLSTHEDECAEQGKDSYEVLLQLAREQKLRDELGIAPRISKNQQGPVAVIDDPEPDDVPPKKKQKETA